MLLVTVCSIVRKNHSTSAQNNVRHGQRDEGEVSPSSPFPAFFFPWLLPSLFLSPIDRPPSKSEGDWERVKDWSWGGGEERDSYLHVLYIYILLRLGNLIDFCMFSLIAFHDIKIFKIGQNTWKVIISSIQYHQFRSTKIELYIPVLKNINNLTIFSRFLRNIFYDISNCILKISSIAYLQILFFRKKYWT